MKAALLAGVQSGCGKTTVSMALLQYLRGQDEAVAPFKAGPDFLDPLWHQAVTGRTSYNLDTHMVGEAESRRLLANAEGDCLLVEGVMGLFDGRSGVGGPGSSVDLARVLGLPVWLVVDTKGMSGSIVPLVAGFEHQAQKLGVRISGVIANRVGSDNHARLLRELLDEHGLPPLLGWLAKNAPGLPERHLGLQRPEEALLPDFGDYLRIDAEQLEQAWGVVAEKVLPRSETELLQSHCVAVASDAACFFHYPANLDWLREQGAELRFFSPLAGEVVPADADALWLPGGYPELYAEALSRSPCLASLREFIKAGKPVLAECGGMMLLGEALVDQQGARWSMAGALPFVSRMQDRLTSLGYREEASGVRGHEFHHSVREAGAELAPAFAVDRGDVGIRQGGLRASYIHWYFASAPQVVAGWLGA